MFKKILYFTWGIVIGITAMAGIAVAAPVAQNFTNIQPFVTDQYDNGTSTLEWLQFFTKNASTTNLSVGVGSVTQPSLQVGNGTAGLDQANVNTLGIVAGGTSIQYDGANLFPTTNNVRGLGTQALEWSNLFVQTASTTNLTVSSLTSGNCVQASTGGSLTTTLLPCGSGSGGNSFGQGWEINSNNALAPTTTIGIQVSASSTIGSGTQIGGLTISGGATTTGNAIISGKLTVSGQTLLQGLNSVSYQTTGAQGVNINSAGIDTYNAGVFGFSSTGNSGGTADTALSRLSAGVLAVGTGAQGNTGGSIIAAASSTIGNGTQPGGLTISGGATTTGNLTLASLTGTQCLHEVNGLVSGTGSDCGSGGGSSFGEAWALDSTKSFLVPTTTVGIIVSASSTIGNGTQAGGLTISGGATTTGNSLISGKLTVTGNTNVTGAIIGSGLVQAGTQFQWGSGTNIQNPVNGVISLNNNGSTDFTRLDFGGTTASFPALQISTTTQSISVGLANGANGGRFGVGTSSPFARLSIAGAAGGTQALFAISTSTSAATTTTFLIDSNGNETLTGSVTWPYLPSCSGSNALNTDSSGKVFCGAVSGGGTVTSVTLASPSNSITCGGTNPITTSGTINCDLNLANPNIWSALQQFGNASTSLFSVTKQLFVGGTSTTTIVGDGATSNFASAVTVATTSATALKVQDQYGTPAVTVNTASTTGPILTVQATSTSDTLFSVDQYGHLLASSTPKSPTVSSCGSGSPVLTAGSNDVTGDVTTGTSASTCTITFGQAYTVTPEVLITDSNTTAVVDISSRSTTAFTISLASALSAVNISYFVIQP